MTRDRVDALERALRAAEPPDAGPARERARRTALAAHGASRPRRRVFRRALPLAWVTLAALAAALFVTQRDSGPAQAVERLVRTIVREPKAAPPAASRDLTLPIAGRLLVSGSDGLFVVNRAGHKTALGRYADASWSPRGLFVAATRGRTLAALDPADGSVRWKLQPGGAVSLPRWGPDGLHVAYRAGGSLRIVYGNGEHDVVAGRDMAPVAPAWQPTAPRTLAWAANDGTVTVEDADTAKVLRTYSSGGVHQLAWSGDGRKLLIAGRRHGTIRDFATGVTTRLRLHAREELLAAAYAPRGDRLALAVLNGDRTEIRVRGDVLFSADGRISDLRWSPDARWLLAGDPATGQWSIAHVAGRAQVSAVMVTPRFGSGARTRGWCC